MAWTSLHKLYKVQKGTNATNNICVISPFAASYLNGRNRNVLVQYNILSYNIQQHMLITGTPKDLQNEIKI